METNGRKGKKVATATSNEIMKIPTGRTNTHIGLEWCRMGACCWRPPPSFPSKPGLIQPLEKRLLQQHILRLENLKLLLNQAINVVSFECKVPFWNDHENHVPPENAAGGWGNFRAHAQALLTRLFTARRFQANLWIEIVPPYTLPHTQGFEMIWAPRGKIELFRCRIAPVLRWQR